MSKNGAVDFQDVNNDNVMGKETLGAGLPMENDFRGATGGDQGGPLFNDYRQSSPDSGDVFSAQFDRSPSGGGRAQPRQKSNRGKS